MAQETIDRFTKLVNDFDARIKSAGTDKWDAPAPCEGWTARDVVAHVSSNLNRVSAALRGQEPREIGADEDPVSTWNIAKDALMTALPTSDLSTRMETPLGEMSAEQFIGRIIATDVLVHTWDLARATGGDEKLDAASVEGAYSGLKPMDAMIRMPGVFGPRIDAPEGADVQTQFLNFTGRTV